MRMWVAVDIQMKGGQFGLVKAIMPTSACAVNVEVCACVRDSVWEGERLWMRRSVCRRARSSGALRL